MLMRFNFKNWIMINLLSIEEMSQTSGGRSKFWDGFCAGVGLVTMAAPWLYLTGVGTVVLGVSGAGCLVREIVLL